MVKSGFTARRRRHYPRCIRLLLMLLALIQIPVAQALAQSAGSGSVRGEYILVAGGPALNKWERYKDEPHDRWWGNFVRAARVRGQEIQKTYGQVPVTIMVYRPAYERRAAEDGQPLISHVQSIQEAYGFKIVWFETTDQFLSYLRSGQNRRSMPIANFEYYGHSNRACFMFDYSNYVANGSRCWLHENELRQLPKGVWARDAFIKSWGCHTGESMSKMFRASTGRRMIGAVGKTDYAYGHERNWVPALSGPDGRWVD